MKNKKGFTLIELLAVIVILAIIALIAIPQVMKILKKARISAAEDSIYGIYNATQDYISRVMIDNGGDFPNVDLTFTCDNTSCKLDNYSVLSSSYNLEETIEYKGKKATDGKIKITNGGKDIVIENLKVNEFYCNHDGEKATCDKEQSELPSAKLYGYKSKGDTNIKIGTSGYETTGKHAYLKYELKNGKATGVPQTCIYSEDYTQKELCLKNNEHEVSKQKILDYFGYDENTWTNTKSSYWKDPSETITCLITTSSVDCRDSVVYADTASYGGVYMYDYLSSFYCRVYSNDTANCG